MKIKTCKTGVGILDLLVIVFIYSGKTREEIGTVCPALPSFSASWLPWVSHSATRVGRGG